MGSEMCIRDSHTSRLHKSLKFSDGWLVSFNRRWKLRTFRSHGESGHCDDAAVEQQLPSIQREISRFSPKDTFNADEFGLNYRMAPDVTIAEERIPGRKKAKERLSVLACANEEGSERIPLMFIRTAWKPRAFKKKTGTEIGLEYHANNKGWMTLLLFHDWIRGFDAYISRTPHRQVALLIENCSAHGTLENLPSLQPVSVFFLPPNTTSKMQPMDAGVIASVKLRYRTFKMEPAVDLIDETEQAKDVYKVDVLTAMRALTRIWEEFPCDIISRCWAHTKLRPVSDKSIASSSNSASLEAECTALQEQILSMVPVHARMAIGHFLNAPGEEECVEDFNEEEALFGGAEKESDDGNTTEGESEVTTQLPSLKEQLRVLAAAKRILVSRADTKFSTLRAIADVQASLRSDVRGSARQTAINEYFTSDQSTRVP